MRSNGHNKKMLFQTDIHYVITERIYEPLQKLLVKIAGLKEYWFIGLVATYLANIIGRGGEFFTIAAIVAMFARAGVSYNLSKKFNKSETWFILSLFFSGITLPLLGYSNTDKYDKDKVVCENAFFNK